MRLLLDTHVFIWYVAEPPALGSALHAQPGSASANCSAAQAIASAAGNDSPDCGSTSSPPLACASAPAATAEQANSFRSECVTRVTEKSDPGGAPTSAASAGDSRDAKYSKPDTAPRYWHGRNPLAVSGSKSASNSTGNPASRMACCHADGLGIAERRR